MEQAGSDGALVLFSIFDTEAEGKLAQALTKQGEVISTSTIERIFKRLNSQ
jgi:hypothetical protein